MRIVSKYTVRIYLLYYSFYYSWHYASVVGINRWFMKKYVFQLPYDVARENSYLQCVQCVQCLDFLEELAVIASYGKYSKHHQNVCSLEFGR